MAETFHRRPSWAEAYCLLVVVAVAVGCGAPPLLQDTTRLGDTFDREGPYAVRAVVGNPERADALTLVYRAGDGAAAEQRLGMGEVQRGIFEASIPGQPAFTHVLYHVVLESADDRWTDPPGAATGGETLAFWVLGSPCASSATCLPGEHCDASGVCRARGGPCSLDLDCGKAFRCSDSRCRLAARACTGDAGCLLGEVCDGLLGECVPRPRCDDGLACPLDFACDGTGIDAVCRRQCAGDTACLPGERCDDHGVCRPPRPCSGPEQCAAPLVCDPVLRLCRVQGGGACAPCAVDADCGGPHDHCLVVDGALRCGKDCSTNGCPSGFACDAARLLPQCRPSAGTCAP